jgi:hypothetical protein
MPSRWVPSSTGEEQLLGSLAAGANAFGELVVDRVKAVERGLERYHFQSAKHPRNVHYVDTINQATYLNGELVGGVDVQGAARPKGDTIHSRVYTTSFLGHMLELTGAKPHEIPIPVGPGVFIIVDHPGFTRRPHFVPGLFSAVGLAGVTMRGKMNVGR